MWKETNIGGVFISPLLPYMLVALIISAILRPILVWLRFSNWAWNAVLAETGLYICILSLLVAFF